MNQPKHTHGIPKDYAEPIGSDTTDFEPKKSDEEISKENWHVFRIVLIVIMIFSFSGFLGQLIRTSLMDNCQ